MKNLMILGVMMVSMIAFAQQVKPKFSKLEDGKVKATYFHENGEVAQKGFFVNEKRHGEWISYDIKGQKTAQAEFNNGDKTGKWFIWNSDKLTQVDYINNQIASVNTWVSKDPVASNKP
jgi:antitoxin component YwqK of YwqJK toxin-antitoxin module